MVLNSGKRLIRVGHEEEYTHYALLFELYPSEYIPLSHAINCLSTLGIENAGMILLECTCICDLCLNFLLLLRKKRSLNPTVLVTASDNSIRIIQAFRTGISDCIRVPPGTDEVDSIISKFFVDSGEEEKGKDREAKNDDLVSSMLETESLPLSVQKALAYIETRFREPLNLKAVADQVLFNPSYLSHVFKKCTGVSFKTYLNGLRIRQSQRLLKDSRQSITEIAYDCGFEDLSNFERTFRKMVGCSPSKYRNPKKVCMNLKLYQAFS